MFAPRSRHADDKPGNPHGCGEFRAYRALSVYECRICPQRHQTTTKQRDTGWAMSQENVELRSLAEAAFGALNSRNLDGFMAVAAEDVEFTSMIAEVEGTTFQGHDGIRTWWETVVGAFGEVHWEVLDVRGVGDRGVAHIRMDGTLGEVPLNLRMWLAARLREGRVTWWSWYRTEQEAREAIGLRQRQDPAR